MSDFEAIMGLLEEIGVFDNGSRPEKVTRALSIARQTAQVEQRRVLDRTKQPPTKRG